MATSTLGSKKPSNISQTKNVALKLPKISLTKRYFGQFKDYIFAVLGHFCLLLRLGGCGSQGLYNRSSCFVSQEGKSPHPQDKLQHLDFTEDPWPLYYKTPPSAFYHKNVHSKAVFGPSVRPKLALSRTGRFLSKAEILGVGVFFPSFNCRAKGAACRLERGDGPLHKVREGNSFPKSA